VGETTKSPYIDMEETKIIQNACCDDLSGNDEDSDDGFGDESDKESDSNLELEENDAIGKNLEDFTAKDMRKLEFSSHSNCIQFYKMYARVKGFGIQNKHPNYSKLDGHITSQLIWCSREGLRAARYLEKKDGKCKEKPISRCGCRAFINFKWDYRTDTWHVTHYNREHNHPLVLMNQVPFIRSQREINEVDKIRIKSSIDIGVHPSVVMRNLADKAGGHHKVGILASDLYNTCETFKKEEIKDGDTKIVIAYLLGKQFADLTFFLRYTRDGTTNGINKMFCCDGICRKNYKAFRIVIAFDTTYKVNAYKKPLMVIVGVNNHRKTVPFDVAMVTDETKAMANAIKAILTNAHHRLCLWHLMRNARTNGNKHFCSGLMKCVDGCNTPDKFEEAWEELVQIYNVRELKWAQKMYEKKEKWSEAFMNGQFFIVLYRFVQLYDRVLEKIRFEEDQNEYISTHTFPVIHGILGEIKTQASQTYTALVYEVSFKELAYESGHIVTRLEEDLHHVDGPTSTYWLNDCVNKDSTCIVLYNKLEQIMCCCCAKLESIGIPCRHMFAVMKYEGMVEIPRGCILRRWTIKSKDHLVDSDDKNDLDTNEDDRAAAGRFAFLSSLNTNKVKSTPVVVDSYETRGTKGKKKGKKRAKEGVRLGKKKKVIQTEIEVEDYMEKEKVDPKLEPKVGTESGLGFSFVKLLKKFIPKTYCSCEAPNAKDCYEISVFAKDKYVFDWDPKKLF
ncbi:Protein FAR1-RELATED SEQUENCE 5, partial [Bienertia sinuspersici]